GDDGGGEQTLIANIVDGQDGAAAVEEGIPCVERLQIERNQGGVPVVAMEDVRAPLHPLAGLDGASREKREAHVLVRVLRIEIGAVVERRAVHEVDPEI